MTKRKHTEGKKETEELKEKTTKNANNTEEEKIEMNEQPAEEAVETTVEQPVAESAAMPEKQEGEPVQVEESISREAELLDEVAKWKDDYIRLMAEFDNYRKRTLKEKIDLTKSAGENILKGLLPIVDDFERALKALENSADSSNIKEGIELIYNKFIEFLKQQGLREIEALNCEFNVDLHEAVNKVAVEDESLKGKVIEVLQKGYYLNDKVIRFSKVVVGE
ncbi:MAG TPA: nucleotide exchange factor GrpE [Bacteroidales bacterium]|nr:nucleotide exchange factor GrpE [Bacteroidales bacterium]HOK73649.1 nucleotide exchange factor GrpE [Bacteroidales bacterium]HOM39355.1 nucleotide exchange factor GrpE [Bacteroidales bacterium]HOU30843.1 nucleotide exchange factor GrpE [Bacteroidales bacterium]HPP91463.1 nucleotide exchange factor GrpE [Bacteroidales bacterium]